MTKPHNHLFEVKMTVTEFEAVEKPVLKMAVWTPGSYLIREYSRNVQDFQAMCNGKKVNFRKTKKNTWEIDTKGEKSFTITYNIYAFDLTVRTAYLDGEHGFLNGACIFMYLEGKEEIPATINIIPYKKWKISTPLEFNEENGFYYAKDFDEIVDSPVECGTHSINHFEVLGKPHEVAIFGKGNFDKKQLLKDLKKIVEVQGEFFGELPYNRYVFIIHFVDGKGGGLEHKNCNVSMFSAHKMRKREDYLGFLLLESHEFFHTWNVKRLRPAPLGPFDYENENYSRCLWICEGWTSYYQDIFLVRAGLMTLDETLKMFGKLVSRVLAIPGRFKQSIAESSFDAWIKLYRPDENTINTTISYYSRGALNAAMGLDLWLREKTKNQKSLDDILLYLWKNYGSKDIGFPEEKIVEIMSEAVGVDLTEYYYKYIEGVEDIPPEWFNYAALEILPEHKIKPENEKRKIPYIGWLLIKENNVIKVKSVLSGSPAEEAGIYARDEILAINSLKINLEKINDRLMDFQPKQKIIVTLFRFENLHEIKVTLGEAPHNKFTVKIQEKAEEEAKKVLEAITGQPFPTKNNEK